MFDSTVTDIVKDQLENDLETRENDKLLILKVWEEQGLFFNNVQKMKFLSDLVASPETIRRTRQKLNEEGEYLPSAATRNARKAKENITRYETATMTLA